MKKFLLNFLIIKGDFIFGLVLGTGFRIGHTTTYRDFAAISILSIGWWIIGQIVRRRYGDRTVKE